MNTYTDVRLPDTSAAVESLPSLPLGKSFVAPMVAPDGVNSADSESIPGTFGENDGSNEKRKNPGILHIQGFR